MLLSLVTELMSLCCICKTSTKTTTSSITACTCDRCTKSTHLLPKPSSGGTSTVRLPPTRMPCVCRMSITQVGKADKSVAVPEVVCIRGKSGSASAPCQGWSAFNDLHTHSGRSLTSDIVRACGTHAPSSSPSVCHGVQTRAVLAQVMGMRKGKQSL